MITEQEMLEVVIFAWLSLGMVYYVNYKLVSEFKNKIPIYFFLLIITFPKIALVTFILYALYLKAKKKENNFKIDYSGLYSKNITISQKIHKVWYGI